MSKNKGRDSELFQVSIHKRNQAEIMPILERLRVSDLGISRTIVRLLIQFKDDGYRLADDKGGD